jgi:hypothetical protein
MKTNPTWENMLYLLSHLGVSNGKTDFKFGIYAKNKVRKHLFE